MNEMNQAVEEIANTIDHTSAISEAQAASTSEITSNLVRAKKAIDDMKKYISTLR